MLPPSGLILPLPQPSARERKPRHTIFAIQDVHNTRQPVPHADSMPGRPPLDNPRCRVDPVHSAISSYPDRPVTASSQSVDTIAADRRLVILGMEDRKSVV